MKVFEVKTQRLAKDSNNLHDTVRYVTTDDDSLLTVAKEYTEYCEQYEEDLVSVREVITICHHIDANRPVAADEDVVDGLMKERRGKVEFNRTRGEKS